MSESGDAREGVGVAGKQSKVRLGGLELDEFMGGWSTIQTTRTNLIFNWTKGMLDDYPDVESGVIRFLQPPHGGEPKLEITLKSALRYGYSTGVFCYKKTLDMGLLGGRLSLHELLDDTVRELHEKFVGMVRNPKELEGAGFIPDWRQEALIAAENVTDPTFNTTIARVAGAASYEELSKFYGTALRLVVGLKCRFNEINQEVHRVD